MWSELEQRQRSLRRLLLGAEPEPERHRRSALGAPPRERRCVLFRSPDLLVGIRNGLGQEEDCFEGPGFSDDRVFPCSL